MTVIGWAELAAATQNDKKLAADKVLKRQHVTTTYLQWVNILSRKINKVNEGREMSSIY